MQDNEDFREAKLVGILRVTKAGLLSGLNNVSVRFLLYSSLRYSNISF